jgi:hypothetical protein
MAGRLGGPGQTLSPAIGLPGAQGALVRLNHPANGRAGDHDGMQEQAPGCCRGRQAGTSSPLPPTTGHEAPAHLPITSPPGHRHMHLVQSRRSAPVKSPAAGAHGRFPTSQWPWPEWCWSCRPATCLVRHQPDLHDAAGMCRSTARICTHLLELLLFPAAAAAATT